MTRKCTLRTLERQRMFVCIAYKTHKNVLNQLQLCDKMCSLDLMHLLLLICLQTISQHPKAPNVMKKEKLSNVLMESYSQRTYTVPLHQSEFLSYNRT